MSDILLADHIAERYGVPVRGRRDLTIVPSPDLCFAEAASVWVYFEVYLLSPDPGGAGRYRVVLDVEDPSGRSVIARVTGWIASALGGERERETNRVVWERTVAPVSLRTPEWFEVRLEDGGTGVRRITIMVTDLASGGTTNTQRAFVVDDESDCEILPGTP